MTKLSTEELEKLFFHNISVKKLHRLCNPFTCWMEIETAITEKEVKDCIDKGQEDLIETPLALESIFKHGKILDPIESKQNHIKKIAYFVKNGFDNPISLDVGVPSMGCNVDYMIEDGNHRFAAAIIREDKFIKCHIMGEEEHAQELGLWKPNKYYDALMESYDQDIEKTTSIFDEVKSKKQFKI